MARLSNSIRRLLLAGFVTALALAAPTTAAAAETQLLGAQSHALWSGSSTEDMTRELNLLDRANASAVRVDLSWSSLETNGKGQYSDWYTKKFDAFLERAEARDIEVIATLWSTPCWASSAPAERKRGCDGAWWDRGVDRYAPSDAGDYGDVAAYVAKRWGSRLRALEVWNEPNLPDAGFLKSADPGRSYATLLKTAYPRIKQHAPDLTVLGGAVAFSDEKFLERLYDLGIKGSFDGLSVHPYNEWRDPDDTWKPQWRKYTFATGVPAMHAVMRDHGDGAKKLWLTEFGFSTCGEGSNWCVSERRQAQYTKDSFKIVGEWDFVEAAIVYNLRNKGSDPSGREDQFGLVERDFTPKPAYAAFKRALGRSGRRSRISIVGRRKVVRRGAIRVRVACRSRKVCAGRLRLRVRRSTGAVAARRKASASRRFRIGARSSKVVQLRLTVAQRRRVAGRGRTLVTAVVATRRSGKARRHLTVLARR